MSTVVSGTGLLTVESCALTQLDIQFLRHETPDPAGAPFTPREAARSTMPHASTSGWSDDAGRTWWQYLAVLFADNDDIARHGRFLASQPLPVLGGVDEKETCTLERYADRVQYMYALLLGQLCGRRKTNALHAAEPPSFALLLAQLAEGMASFEHARKTEDTPFPFPCTLGSAWLGSARRGAG